MDIAQKETTMKAFFISVPSVMISILLVSRTSSSWESLISDVGTSGAWTVSIILSLTYGFVIGAGNSLSVAVIKQEQYKKLLLFIILSSIVSVVIYYASFSIIKEHHLSFSLLCLLLFICGFIVTAIILLLRNKITCRS